MRKIDQKMKSVEFFKATVPYFESNLKVIYFPKKERVNFHELYSRTKKFFGGQHILNHNEISFSAINMIDTIANGLKPMNDKSKDNN